MAEKLHEQSFGWHADLPDVPGKSAADMKAFFDAPHHLFLERINELIDEVEKIGQQTTDLEERAEQFENVKWRVSDIEEALPGEPIQMMYPTVYAVVKFVEKLNRTLRGLINGNKALADGEIDALKIELASIGRTMEEIRSNTANAVRGAVTGSVLSINDISPLTRSMKLQLISKNILPYPFHSTTETINGVTFTDNGDGTVTANGTATADAIYYLRYSDQETVVLPKGTYTISGMPQGSDYHNTYYLGIRCYRDGVNVQTAAVEPSLIEIDSFDAFYIVVKAGQTVEDLVFKPQLESGTVATDFTPGIADFSTVNVSTVDNVLNLKEIYKNRSMFTVFDDFSYYTNATYSSHHNGIAASEAFELEAGTYWWEFDVKLVGGTHKGVFARLCNADTAAVLCNADFNVSNIGEYEHKKVSFTLAEKTRLLHRTQSSATDGVTNYRDSYVKNLIIYKEKTDYQADATGNVELTSVSPKMTLTTDNGGVVLGVEYNRDLNKVIENITQAIISLGGNV